MVKSKFFCSKLYYTVFLAAVWVLYGRPYYTIYYTVHTIHDDHQFSKLSLTSSVDNFLHTNPFTTKPAPIDRAHWELFIGTDFIINRNLWRMLWRIKLDISKPHYFSQFYGIIVIVLYYNKILICHNIILYNTTQLQGANVVDPLHCVYGYTRCRRFLINYL